ncbi:hypothetical protein NKI64_25220 [Mesorhizobium sp. M0478]
MELQAHVGVGPYTTKCLHNAPKAVVVRWDGGKRGSASPVDFVEYHHAPLTKMPRNPPQHLDRIGREHKDVSANNCVERYIESEGGRITLVEDYILQTTLRGSRPSSVKSLRRPVRADNKTCGSDNISREKGDIASAAPHVKDMHSRSKASSPQVIPGHRVNQCRLRRQPSQFSFRMSQLVFVLTFACHTGVPPDEKAQQIRA